MKEQTADDEKETEGEDRVGYNWLAGWMLLAYMFGCYQVLSWCLLTKPYLSWCRLARDLGEILLERATGWISSTFPSHFLVPRFFAVSGTIPVTRVVTAMSGTLVDLRVEEGYVG